MPVQDLTPQLRTRLGRVERAVGWFVMLATVLLLAGFGYYVYHTAQRKGWFLRKLRYHTFLQSGAGLRVGDPVKLMGFDIGQITEITPMPPFSPWGNVYIQFLVREPFDGYIWTDSYVKMASSGLLGGRTLEVVQGGTTGQTNLHASYDIDPKTERVKGVWSGSEKKYVPYTPDSKGYSFPPATESPVITDRLDQLANQVDAALPGIFALTNQVSLVLSNVANATATADTLLAQARPMVTNVTLITGLLTNGQGALGNWAIPTNISLQLERTLASANATLNTANTNVATLGSNLNLTLENLANITSNLNAQVQTNDQILGQISEAIVNADNLVQGLKRHWLLRSAFKNEPKQGEPAQGQPGPAPPATPIPAPTAGPKTGKRIPPGR
jgi:ABC-type transporter Mla subunit MlaD